MLVEAADLAWAGDVRSRARILFSLQSLADALPNDRIAAETQAMDDGWKDETGVATHQQKQEGTAQVRQKHKLPRNGRLDKIWVGVGDDERDVCVGSGRAPEDQFCRPLAQPSPAPHANC